MNPDAVLYNLLVDLARARTTNDLRESDRCAHDAIDGLDDLLRHLRSGGVPPRVQKLAIEDDDGATHVAFVVRQ